MGEQHHGAEQLSSPLLETIQKLLAARAEERRKAPVPLSGDLQAVARLALNNRLATNVDAELEAQHLTGWRLDRRPLITRGEWHQGFGSHDEGEEIPGSYDYVKSGSLESVLGVSGHLWVVAHRAYRFDSIDVDATTHIPRDAVVDRFTGIIDEQHGSDWLIDKEYGAAGTYTICANPSFVRARLAELVVRTGLLENAPVESQQLPPNIIV